MGACAFVTCVQSKCSNDHERSKYILLCCGSLIHFMVTFSCLRRDATWHAARKCNGSIIGHNKILCQGRSFGLSMKLLRMYRWILTLSSRESLICLLAFRRLTWARTAKSWMRYLYNKIVPLSYHSAMTSDKFNALAIRNINYVNCMWRWRTILTSRYDKLFKPLFSHRGWKCLATQIIYFGSIIFIHSYLVVCGTSSIITCCFLLID